MKPKFPALPKNLKLERFQGRLYLKMKGLGTAYADAPPVLCRGNNGDWCTIGTKISDNFKTTEEITQWVELKLKRELDTTNDKIKNAHIQISFLETDKKDIQAAYSEFTYSKKHLVTKD